MNGDWTLIIRGFFLAGIGAASTILYIVAVSAAYVGKFTLSAIGVAAGGICAFVFLRSIGAYLDAIDQREERESARMKTQTEKSKT